MAAERSRKSTGLEAGFEELFSMPSSNFGAILNTDFRVDVAVHANKERGRSFEFRFYNGMGYNSAPGREDKAGVMWMPEGAFTVRTWGEDVGGKPIYAASLYKDEPGESEFLDDKNAHYGILLGNDGLGPLPVLVLALRKYRSDMIKKLEEEQHITEHAKTVGFLYRANLLCEFVEAYMAEVFEAPLKEFARKHEAKDATL